MGCFSSRLTKIEGERKLLNAILVGRVSYFVRL